MDIVSFREPLGITAGITPFNFPVMIPLWMFPVAITCGNTFILKPSERVTGASVFLMELLKQTGIPKGVVNMVNGGKDVVGKIIRDQNIKAISFVGSSRVGDYIYKEGTKSDKRVQSNGQAKNHTLILPDANRESVINQLVGAAFGACGQRCMALSVAIFIGESNSWIQDLISKASRLTLGPGIDNKDLGPLISQQAKTRIIDIIDKSIKQGGKLLLDGRQCKEAQSHHGNYLGPTIIEVDSLDNVAYTEEIFGPILTIIKVKTFDEALNIINKNKYGNGASIFTQSGNIARKFQNLAQPGQIGINVAIPVPLPMFSFTGNKGSFQGDLNFYGKQGVLFNTKLKTITSKWQSEIQEIQTSMPQVKQFKIIQIKFFVLS